MQNKINKILNFTIEFSILAIIFIVPIYFATAQETYSLFILNKQVIFHCLLAIGWASQLLIINYQFLINFLKQNKLLFLLISLLLLSFLTSTIFSIHPGQSLWGSFERQEGFYSFINYLLFFALLVFHLNSPQQNTKSFDKIKRLIIAVMLSSFVVTSYGILQYFGLDFLDWKNSDLPFQRVVSTLGQPNFLGHYLIMVIPLTVFGLFFITKKNLPRFFVSLLVAIQLTCLSITYSRAAWVGFAAGLIVFFILNKKTSIYKNILIMSCALIILLFIGNSLNFEHRIKSILNIETGSNKVRMLTWGAAINEIKNSSLPRLLFGHGPETQHSIFAKHYKSEWGIYETINVYPDRTHNNILDTILQFGILYCFIAVWLYSYILHQSLKFLRKDSNISVKSEKSDETQWSYWLILMCLIILISYFINNLFSFSLVTTSVYFYLVLAILLHVTHNMEHITQSMRKVEHMRWNAFKLLRVMRYVLYFTCYSYYVLCVFFYDIKSIKADYYYMNADRARLQDDCNSTLENIEKAIKLNPRSNYYKEDYITNSTNCLGKLENSQQRHELSEKIINIINAIPTQEYNIGTLNTFARAYALLGAFVNPQYYDMAYVMYNEVVKINPYFTTVYRDLAKLNLWQENYDQALVNLDQFFKVTPPLDHPNLIQDHREEIELELLVAYKISGDVFYIKKEYTKAINSYRMALSIDPNNLEVRHKIASIKQL